jgi:hypothetical protein
MLDELLNSDKDFASRANDLLKRQNLSGMERALTGDVKNLPDDKDQLLRERLAALQEKTQLLIQMRDEAQAWHEAFLKERERADRYEKILFEGVVEKNENPEVKHTVSTPAQVSRRRSNWPSVKATLEKRFVGSASPDLGSFSSLQLQSLNDADLKELEKTDETTTTDIDNPR